MAEDQLDESAVEKLVAEAAGSPAVLFIPSYRTEDDLGVYGESTIELFKQLRGDGLDAAWADDPDRRTYSARRSAEVIQQVVFAVATGAVGNAVWAAISGFFRSRANARARLTIWRHIRSDGSSWERIKYSGTGAEIADLMDRDALPAPDPDGQ